MRKTLLWLGFFGLFSVIYGKLRFFDHFIKHLEWNEDNPEDDYKRIEELANFLRRHAEEAETSTTYRFGGDEILDSPEESYPEGVNPSTLYPSSNGKPKYTRDPDFAVGPSDPRYYQKYVNFGKPERWEFDYWRSPKREQQQDGISEAYTGRPMEDASLSESYETLGGESSSPRHSAVYQYPVSDLIDTDDRSDVYFIAIVAGCSAAAVVAIVAIGISCYRLQKNAKAAAEVEYPAYGVTGPHKDVSPTSGDRRLAQSAQMYHYQHQKQQIIAMESRTNDRHGSISDAESDEENEEGDYTVYECPGLASTGEMEVKNPLFQDDPTPATPVRGVTHPSPKSTAEQPNLIIFD